MFPYSYVLLLIYQSPLLLNVTVQAKTSLVHTSYFAQLWAIKSYLRLAMHKAKIFRNDKVMFIV